MRRRNLKKITTLKNLSHKAKNSKNSWISSRKTQKTQQDQQVSTLQSMRKASTAFFLVLYSQMKTLIILITKPILTVQTRIR